MKLLLSPSRDIYFNLALEEYLLKRDTETYFMLWQSEDSVVVGKHQNAMAEINYRFLQREGVPVARRLSGGGTVFHGDGNVNFTYLINGEKGKLIDFRRFVSPVVDYLATLGIPAEIGTRNDILVEGLKVSGNAEHVYRSRVLHHGTLLFGANLERLNMAIQVVPGRFTDRAVQSNRSKVTNISNYLNQPMSVDDFVEGLLSFMEHTHQTAVRMEFPQVIIRDVQKLRDEKYSTPEWIFAYSPPFTVNAHVPFEGRDVALLLAVKNGVVENVQITGVAAEAEEKIRKGMAGKPFVLEQLRQSLTESADLHPEWIDRLMNALF